MNRCSNFEIKIVQEIIDEAIMNNKPHFLIKWKNLPHQNDTWESIENLEGIVQILKKWIRKRRQQTQAGGFQNAIKYCDTVNYVNPMKKTLRKRKFIRKKKLTKQGKHQIVNLDDDNFQAAQKQYIIKKESDCQSNDFNESQKEQKIDEQIKPSEDRPIKACNKWRVNPCNKAVTNEFVTNNENLEKIQIPLRFNPEQIPEKNGSVGQSLKSGMKVIGHVRSQDIQNIIEHFTYKQTLCFKIQLTDGRITNMRETDLKKLCPQMLMEYFEENNIKF